MRLQFLKFLTIFLLTLTVLSPELAVLSIVWEQHMQLVETQHLVCEVNPSHTGESNIISIQETNTLFLQLKCTKYAQETADIKIFDVKFLQKLLTHAQVYKVVDFLKWFFVFFPIFLGILAFLYDRYIVYRATVFQQKIDMLERLWQESIEQ